MSDEDRRRRDEEDERRELEEAGWELVERHPDQKFVVWRNPESGHLYPQQAALAWVRERAHRGEPFGDSEYSW